jgi:hypothetical protein
LFLSENRGRRVSKKDPKEEKEREHRKKKKG